MFISLPILHAETILVTHEKCNKLLISSILYAFLCIEFPFSTFIYSLNLPFWYITLHIYVYKYGVELLTGISTDIT